MNEETSNVSRSGIGFFGLLQIAFIVLKVTKLINWSWWLVFLPAFIKIGIFIIGFFCVLLALVVKEAENDKKAERKNHGAL